MGRAWFEDGKFYMNGRHGKLVWMGSYWVSWGDLNSESGQIHMKYYDRRFLSWYNRKGKYIENRWREKRARIRQRETPRIMPQVRTNINRESKTTRGGIFYKIYTTIISIIKFFITLAIIGMILYGIYYVATSGILNKINLSDLNGLSSQQINQSWANQFFVNVSQQRGSNYIYCPALSQFAQIRFNTQISNYDISHYGVSQDDEEYGIYDAEEVLFPSGSPAGYASKLNTEDPAHWQILIDNSYIYYGDYIGNGPDVESYCNPGPEIPGPGINISQYLESQGCTPVTTTATYFMVELDNVCPSTLT